MKFLIFILFTTFYQCTFAQSLQLHYDPRHLLDPGRNAKNFYTLYFEYFKTRDSGKYFIKPRSFLLKMQADFLGEKKNMGKFYMQVSQSLRFWKPNIFLSLQYSGGLGITEPKEYSYYIPNTFSAGAEYPFTFRKTYLTCVIYYKYTAYAKPTHDVLYTFYWWRGAWNYKAEIAGDFSIWTENKNRGDDFTKTLKGKRFSFFGEPQFWYNVVKEFSIGTKVNMYYHVLTAGNVLLMYPTAAVRWKL